MRTGNAILIAFFICLAIYLPGSMYTTAQSYPVTWIYGLSADAWMIIGFLVPICAAIISAVCGMEKSNVKFNRHPGRKPAVTIEKTDIIDTAIGVLDDVEKPVIVELEPVETKPEPVENKHIKQYHAEPKIYNTKDVEDKVDRITSKREIEMEE